ncbi:DUF72 domain-containing protein [Pacificimonas flava]|uniref:DUF72 domain-containing protein n=1 Tax=Pacificimonas flava TaxID=1234595 RepID=M2U4Z6_9SPHN|nr:DUF72 domain-containing protein [Pacificimonas flava]EMD83063.1 hypothetical protein C725_1661 [Pacificimonas flava]MBB5280219.1 uncharacterized protein YecE (DUF72 family) [Pacificimonas flava]
MTRGKVHIGIGGWTYEPWRGTFYPDGLRQKDELAYAAEHLTGLEINATYYRLQKPQSFANWADAAPPGFRFAVKASRYATNRKNLAEAGEAIETFCAQGLTELGEKLGPILWQLAPTKRFDADEIGAFLDMLPKQQESVPLRHALEVRHASFADTAFVELARHAGVAIVLADHAEYPQIADLTSDFVYARLMQSREDEETGYPAAELDEWARIAGSWRDGHAPEGLHYAATKQPRLKDGRDVFLFFIAGAKVRNPAAARSLIDRC